MPDELAARKPPLTDAERAGLLNEALEAQKRLTASAQNLGRIDVEQAHLACQSVVLDYAGELLAQSRDAQRALVEQHGGVEACEEVQAKYELLMHLLDDLERLRTTGRIHA